MKLSALLLLLLLCLAAPATAAERVRPAGATGELGNELLSDELKLTRWAHVYTLAKIRRKANRFAPSIGRLRYQTEDELPEVYIALRSKLDSRKRVWIQIRVPGRPNGRKGWVPRESLGPLYVVRTHLRVNRTTLQATLYRRGRKIWSSPIGVGAASTPTPAGKYWIRERLKALGGAYGPWAFGTAAYSSLSEWPGGGVIGIHGTNQPELIPGRPSHGCIRVPNHKIEQLVKLMPVGTPVEII